MSEYQYHKRSKFRVQLRWDTRLTWYCHKSFTWTSFEVLPRLINPLYWVFPSCRTGCLWNFSSWLKLRSCTSFNSDFRGTTSDCFGQPNDACRTRQPEFLARPKITLSGRPPTQLREGQTRPAVGTLKLLGWMVQKWFFHLKPQWLAGQRFAALGVPDG